MGAQAPANPYETGKLPAGMIIGGRYLLLSKIAQGGMGAVYEAREAPGDALIRAASGSRLAIKEMSLSILSRLPPGQQQVLVESFHREFDLLSRLSHPNLVQAYQFFEEQSRFFFVMEFIEGRTLETVLDTLPMGQFLPLERVLAWARQLCDVLHYLHMQTPPIIYRDLKPSNVMELYPPLVDEHGELLSAVATSAEDVKIKLFDFGIARFYKPGQKSDTVRFGTDGYLAPEIIAYQVQTSERTDVYALGAMLHQVLTHFDPQMNPWKRPDIRSVNPHVPEYVAKAIDHALALNPASRTPSAAEFLKELFGKDARPSIDLRETPVPPVQASSPVMAPLQPPPPVINAGQPLPSSAVLLQAAPAAAIVAVLDLGAAQSGRPAAGSFEVILTGPFPASGQPAGVETLQGQVKSASSWLKVDPEYFSAHAVQSGVVNVHVQAHTKNLPLGRWEIAAAVRNTASGKSTVPLWYSSLQRKGILRSFLRRWLSFHLNLFVPLPSRHQGLVRVSIPGNPEMQIQVFLEVFPPAWRSFTGWVLVFGMIGFEVSLLFTSVLMVVSLLVAMVV